VLRGFRWPLVFLVLAIILLGVAIIFQPTPPPAAMVTPSPSATPPPVASAPLPLPPAAVDAPIVVREGVVGQARRLNPLFALLNPVDQDITRLIFEGLVTTNAYGEYLPQLAVNWTIAPNGLEYVFRLRQDILWQDGIPFTATDVATTFNLLQAPGGALPEALTSFWRTVEVELLDEYTVRFRLAQPLAAFLDYLRLGILPAHVFQGLAPDQLPGHPFNLSPIGTGPYQLESITGDTTGIAAISLRVAPVYRQRPEGQATYQIERLVFRLFDSEAAATDALRSGEIDALGGLSGQELIDLEQAGVIQTHITLAPTLGLVLYNWGSDHTPALRDNRIRLALTLGVDRAGLVNRHLSGRAVLADSPIIPGSWAYAGPVSWPAYDPGQALEILSEVSFATPEPQVTATPEGTPPPEPTAEPEVTPTPTDVPPVYDFALLTADDPLQISLSTDLVAQWTQLGLNVRLEHVSLARLFERLEAGEFDAALLELTLSPRVDPDPYVFWHQGQSPDGQNYGAVSDRRSSELLELARRDANGIHRAEYYAEFQQIFAARTLALLLYYPVYEYAVSARIEGVEIGYLSTPADRFFNLSHWILPGE
jgi:peptide/nickel transport system substrate-binding protein